MTIPLGNSLRSYLKRKTQSLISLVNFFVQCKSIFFLPTFKQSGINSIHKYTSTTRFKSKTFALKYLGQKLSQLSPKPPVRKLVSLSFHRHFWLWQYFCSAAFIWPLKLSEHYEPGNHSKNLCQTAWESIEAQAAQTLWELVGVWIYKRMYENKQNSS